MFQRLLDLSRTRPERELWERINEGMPAVKGDVPNGRFPGVWRIGRWAIAEAGGVP